MILYSALLLSLLCVSVLGELLNNTTDELGCVNSDQCPMNSECIDNKCVDVCEGVCGFNTICEAINHQPMCFCKTGFTGDPFTGCQPADPECKADSECIMEKTCVNQTCVDPCPGDCGINTDCKAVNHRPVCACSRGFTWDPPAGCQPRNATTCIANDDCGPGRTCIGHKCLDPCSICGPNTECHLAFSRIPMCSCKPGFVRRPLYGCVPDRKPECTSSHQCPTDRACLNNACVDPCPVTCGANTFCEVIEHFAVCFCNKDFDWALPTCQPKKTVECTSDSDCTENRACQDYNCVDLCVGVCGNNTDCTVTNHRYYCSCSSGFSGNPILGCESLECTSDSSCEANRACQDNKCVDPCVGVCGDNTDCNVTNHRYDCSCKPGFTGNPILGCRPHEDAVVKSKKYYIGFKKVKWSDAMTECSSRNMILATINKQEEQEELERTFKDMTLTDVAGYWVAGTVEKGVTSTSDNKYFYWETTGKYFNYTKWLSGQPKATTSERCVVIDINASYKWNINNCNSVWRYVCEYHSKVC